MFVSYPSVLQDLALSFCNVNREKKKTKKKSTTTTTKISLCARACVLCVAVCYTMQCCCDLVLQPWTVLNDHLSAPTVRQGPWRGSKARGSGRRRLKDTGWETPVLVLLALPPPVELDALQSPACLSPGFLLTKTKPFGPCQGRLCQA